MEEIDEYFKSIGYKLEKSAKKSIERIYLIRFGEVSVRFFFVKRIVPPNRVRAVIELYGFVVWEGEKTWSNYGALLTESYAELNKVFQSIQLILFARDRKQ